MFTQVKSGEKGLILDISSQIFQLFSLKLHIVKIIFIHILRFVL